MQQTNWDTSGAAGEDQSKTKGKEIIGFIFTFSKKNVKNCLRSHLPGNVKGRSSEAKKYLDNEPIFFVILPLHTTIAHFKSKNQDMVQVQTFCFKSNIKFNQKFKFAV